jgi:hypothetical protein
MCHVIAPSEKRRNGKRHRRERPGEAASVQQGVSDSKATRIRAQHMRGNVPLAQGVREVVDVALRVRGAQRIGSVQQ